MCAGDGGRPLDRQLNPRHLGTGYMRAPTDRVMTTSRSGSTFISLSIHAAAIAIFLLASKQFKPAIQEAGIQILHLTDPVTTTIGGGGGMHANTPASSGHLPKIEPRQFVPPSPVVNPQPKLVMEPSIEGPPELALLDKRSPDLGDPLSKLAGSSAGTGGPLGIGNGHGTGVGNKAGPAAGNGDQSSEPVFKPGNGVTTPILIHRVEPEFSEEARKAKYSGTVLIRAEIDRNGHPRNLRLAKSLGSGLDEKALEAVNQWLFKPGTKDGKPVTVSALIEVTFHLL
jgi:protein TonB